MLRNHGAIVASILMAFDVLLSSAICFLLLMQPEISGLSEPLVEAGSPMLLVLAVACLIWPFTFQQLDVYESVRTLGIWDVTRRLLVSGVVVATILGAVAFATEVPLARDFPFICAGAQGLALGLLRVVVYGVLRTARRVGRNTRNILVVGSGARAAQVKRSIDAHPSWGLQVVGFVDDVDTAVDPSLYAAKLFHIDHMPQLLGEMVVDRVLVAVPRSKLGSIGPVLSACSSTGVPLTLMTDLFGDYLPTPWVSRFGERPSLEFAVAHHNRFMLGVKRAIDVVGASVALVVSAPIVALAALAIWKEDGGSIFFKQERCGLYGRTFQMLKLRTMCEGAEERQAELVDLNEMDGPVFKVRLDPRITKVGAILRRFSIDELPQFWNVLRGDMSLVGPRPPVPAEVMHYEISERRRLSMRPGITCIWQVGGRNEIGFTEWVKLDLQYIDSWSLALDVKILAQTIPAVVLARGAS